MGNKKEKLIKAKKLQGKLISLFSVVTKEDYDNLIQCGIKVPHKYLTLTTTPEECLEFIDTLEYEDHREHYIAWCEQRNLNFKEDESWRMYQEIVLGDTCDYAIFELKITWEDVIAFLRMFQGCVPLGCSFDRTIEKVYFASQIKKMFNDKLKEDKKDDLDDLLKTKEINKEDIVN